MAYDGDAAEEFGWHVLSECPNEAACSIHGRNEAATEVDA